MEQDEPVLARAVAPHPADEHLRLHLLTADAVPDPQALPLRLTVNGEVRQDATTAQMVFPVAAIVAFLSQLVTLLPGDIIATGTPAGVCSASGTYLRPGDVVAATIAGIGTLENPVVAEG